jgi:uncharacterized iron-regulated protein
MIDSLTGLAASGRLAKLRLVLPLVLLTGVWACQAPADSANPANPADSADLATDAWAAPPFEASISVRDGHTGEVLSWPQLIEQLAQAEAVFLGETHIDESTHRLELAVYEALLERSGGKVTLAMEMFQRDAQDTLDAYLAGSIDEAAFLADSQPWGNYATAYRALIERAKAEGRPVIASNFPNSLRRRMAQEGIDLLQNLAETQRHLVPTELFANSPSYWRRVDNAIRGHIGMMGGPADAATRLTSTQSLWDNSMGEACALALEQNPNQIVLHVNGGFHSQYWDGTVHQLMLRRPETKVKTIAIAPTGNPQLATISGAPVADYVVFVHALATDVNEGTHSVYVQRELKYRLHVPENLAPGAQVPLLIWLVDRGFNAQDGMDLWRSRLGDSAAIVAIEPPYSALQDDQSIGGRWYWPESFAEDVGYMQSGIEQIWGYVLRHHAIDPNRVCLAGEGTGATVVSVVTLFAEDLALQSIAFAPQKFSKIKDLPLPLPEYRAEGWAKHKSLQVVTRMENQDWWSEELSAYQKIGLANELGLPAGDDWTAEITQENQLRAALGLDTRVLPVDANRLHIVVGNTSKRGHFWARLLAAKINLKQGSLVAVFDRAPGPNGSERVQNQIQVAQLVAGDHLPACPGPFGGTTVLVLPETMKSDQSKPWFELENDDPLTKRSRFLRLRIAQAQGEYDLPTVLAKLESEGRKNILIVPAVFNANPDSMRALSQSVQEFDNRMTLHWQSGLGGQIAKSHP